MNVLIAEPMAQAGIELFQAQQGWNVIVSNPKEYAKHLAEADALIVRSAVQVTPEVLKQAPKLRVIGRAGVENRHNRKSSHSPQPLPACWS